MAKARKNKKSKADAVYAKKSATLSQKSNPFAVAKPATAKWLNPFEVHVNKEKFQILGRTCKHDKGLPGVSRAKAAKKRKETLGQEYLQKHKTNNFRDRRIGKHLGSSELSAEVLNARYLADQMSQFKSSKSSKFDLNDDEVLTHRGTTLEEIEQFRDERSEDEDEEGERLDADFTETAHFGGGDSQVKDRKTAIEDMIVEQKKRKIEIAKEKDEVHNLTEKLDSNYKDLLGLMGKINKKGEKEKPVPDEFDKLMRELIFEPRGEVSDKLETVEEIAKKEKERLERLEQERLRRMQGDGDERTDAEQPKHRSADDLDDGYFATAIHDDLENNILAYNSEGKWKEHLTPITRAYHVHFKQPVGELNTKEKSNGIANGENSADEAAGEQDDMEEAEEENDGSEAESDEESDDDLSDLKSDESDDNEEAEPSQKSASKLTDKEKRLSSKIEASMLPYTIEMPAKYEDFLQLMSKYTQDDQATIVERLIKCNHPKLEGANREKVVKLFAFLMQYLNELFGEATTEDVAQRFKLLDKLNPHLYDLVQLNAEKMANTLLDVIKEKYAEYKKRPKVFPTLETLVFFKLVSNFFTTSDFRHPVVTPSFIFIEQILQRARVRTRQDIATGLFLVSIVLEYTHQSKRFLPGAFNFLLGILFLCVPKRAIEMLKIIPPFQSKGPLSSLLTLTEEDGKNMKKDCTQELLKSEDLLSDCITIDFKVRALDICLQLITESMGVVGENIGSNYLSEPLLLLFERLPIDAYPSFVKNSFETAKKALNEVFAKRLTKLVPPEKKPKALRLLEPRFEAVYDDKRRPKMSKEKEEKAKLVHKIKRETKGAVREIRRDTEFLQKMRIQQQIQSDVVRKEKVKRILHEASVQQGELNELARSKKRKKF